MTNFSQRLQRVASNPKALTQFGRGIEREALRITADERLSVQPHPKKLGAPLTHRWITTDYAESLLEFITPVATEAKVTLSQLSDIHRFVYTELGSETLWPMSMPCFVEGQEEIALAQYGQSNIGQMKTLYREGLKHRYGSVMQIISGVHFNFSFPTEFWDQLFGEQNEQQRQAAVSDAYFGLIRNYYRFGWIISYLFGASPALCGSFIKDMPTQLPFEKTDKGTHYLPYATSLRLSDLGYTNNAQSCLRIGFNSIEQYLEGLQAAIRTPSEAFAELGVKEGEQYRQLNSNILQIENELYAPIRPKRVAESGEKPSQALQRGGVEYIEVRSLDVNPFSPVGIDEQQVRFLDLFLTWAVLSPSAPMSDTELDCWRENWHQVVVAGRDPEQVVKIGCGESKQTLQMAAKNLFAELHQVAEKMDALTGNTLYTATCAELESWIEDPDKTISARLLKEIVEKQSMASVAKSLTEQHMATLQATGYQYYSSAEFTREAADSWLRQQKIEAADVLTFDEFLKDYFVDIH
ncbi:glutamate--cysteine ligase [Thaumasiovibrio sp. DFM-14]|uniref:glutamate--cysteine ligase n=1 Tax=Thaumasiovibrio sp. DFM-14 TaxID=3384792 RepID=UPI00399FDE0E